MEQRKGKEICRGSREIMLLKPSVWKHIVGMVPTGNFVGEDKVDLALSRACFARSNVKVIDC